MKKYILSGSLGIAIGAIISLIMSALFGEGTYLPVNPVSTLGSYYYQEFSPVVVMGISLVLWFLIGLLFQLADLCFEQEWSLMKMTFVHFLVTVTGFTVLGILAGWFPLSVANLLFFWFLYLMIYVLLYWLNFRKMKEAVQLINQSLDK